MNVSPDLAQPGVQHDLQYWFRQHTDYTSAPSSATELINEFTGTHFTNEDTVADYARQEGWLNSSGMDFGDLPALLDHFGLRLPHEESAGTDPPASLHRSGTHGRRPAQGGRDVVNAADYWYQDGGAKLITEERTSRGADRRHRRDEGVAICPSTGDPDGKGHAVPYRS